MSQRGGTFRLIGTGRDTVVGSIQFSAITRLSGDGTGLELGVSVTNLGAAPVPLSWSGCKVNLQLHRYPLSSSRADFDWLARPNPDPATGGFWGCQRSIVKVVILPGVTHSPLENNFRVDARNIASPELAAGAYTVTAILRLMEPAAIIKFPAGMVQLER